MTMDDVITNYETVNYTASFSHKLLLLSLSTISYKKEIITEERESQKVNDEIFKAQIIQSLCIVFTLE